MEKYAVIVAGGSGSRMNSSMPKQFIPLQGKPILMHTLERFYESDPTTHIILVLPKNEQEAWFSLAKSHQFTIPHVVVSGGRTRFQSVKNGLMKVPFTGLVAIHDGVRPFITHELIGKSYEEAAKYGNAVVAVASKDSLRKVYGHGKNESVNRAQYRIVQTPQTFQSSLIKKAFNVEEQTFFTDDASVFEYAGHEIHLIEGDYRNIKITTPEDLLMAEVLLR